MAARAPGFGPWRLLLPLLLALATAGALLHLQQFRGGQDRMEQAVGASEAAAARLAVARVRALGGTAEGYEALEAARLPVPELVKTLRERPPEQALSPPPPQTGELIAAWQAAAARAEEMEDTAPGVQALARDAERLQSVATGLLVSADELVDALLAAEAKPPQVRAAARQLMLVQRISTNLRRLMEPDAGLLVAADRLGRDAVVFGEVATGLLHGSAELGIPRVEDDNAREILAAVGREFRVLAQSVEAVVAGAAASASLVKRGERLAAALAIVDTHNLRLRADLAARAANRLVMPAHALGLAGLTAVSVLAALALGFAERRAARRDVVREAADLRTERAALEGARDSLSRELEQLASDIHRIADGDVGLRAHTGAGDSAAVGVARAGLDRLRQQLRQRTEDGLRLARSGQMVGDVAGRLRDASRRHAHQAEAAGQATRTMAAALDGLRLESAQVGEAARQSGVSAQQASHALGETLHELDAVRAGVEDCAERVRALEDVARELRAVRTLVEDVGELGKMLSLNVAIQASVDSAASRALAAFSEEVQRLANRARSAVTQVEAIHAELRGEAERAASAAKESVWRARSAAERARGARASVEELSGAARRLEDLNHALSRAHREHAVNVTEVVRTITALHALTREVREQVDATADSAAAFGDAAAGLERRLAAPDAADPVIEIADTRSAEDGAEDTPQEQQEPAASRILGRWP